MVGVTDRAADEHDIDIDIDIRILGPLEVVARGRRVDLPSRRQRALLAALAVRDRPVPVGDLVDAVWDDEPPDGARTTLQTYVSRLRRQLGSHVIRYGPAGYRLDSSVVTDVLAVRAGARHLDEIDPADALGRGDLALGLLQRWSGTALAEFADVEWFVGARIELDELRANLHDIAGESLVSAGRAPQAVALLEQAIALHPWREPSRVLLLRALAAAGRHTEAVRSAARYRKELGEVTGLVPGRAFDDAEAAVLAGDVLEDPVGSTVADAPQTDASSDRATSGAPRAVAKLPRPTPLIGRADDLRRLAVVARRAGVITVTGPGGIGKTRLVAELLSTLDVRCPVVELAPVRSGEVAATVGAALGIRGELADGYLLAERLAEEPTVLVLDNAEHVVAEVSELCRSIATHAPELTIIVTSRTRLGLADEVVLSVDPLPARGAGSDAATMFLDRFRRAGPRHDLASDDPTVERLCRRLDGVPLALELAASRAAVLGLDALDRLLDGSLEVLGEVDGPADRHASLGNVVAWSVGLLGQPAQRLLAALSVFRGEFDLDAAVAVGAVVVDDPVAGLLGRLVDTSLVRPSAAPGTFRLLEMVRAFAADRLDELERVGEVRRAHATWIRTQVAAIDERVPGSSEAEVVGELDALRHEVRTSIRWSVDSGDVEVATDIASALAGILLYRPDVDLLHEVARVPSARATTGSTGEAMALAAGARAAFLLGRLDAVDEMAERAITAAPSDQRVRNRAAHARGVVRLYQGDFDDARRWFEAVTGSPDVTRAELLDALGGAALARCYLGDGAGASAAVEQMRGMLVATPSATYRCFATYAQGEIHLASGDVDEAAELLRIAADEAWDVGAAFVWGIAATVLASVLVRHRPPAEAREHLPRLVERWRRTATWPQQWTTLRLVAEHLAATGDAGVARLILAAAERDASAPTVAGDDRVRLDRLVDDLGRTLGAPTAAAIDAAAATVDRVTVVERALDALDPQLAG
jgi:predicted ATPase/DNA-binding SARP family transcriptional activator